MKQYDRKTKTWVEAEKIKANLKKKENCKGNRSHDWVRVLPWGVESMENYNGDVEPYYKAMKEIEEFRVRKDEEMLKLGIKSNFNSAFSRYLSSKIKYREEMCPICLKKRTVNIEE